MKQGLQIGQRATLAPGIRQALSVLRLPTSDLLDLISREADENPFLLVEQRRPPRSTVSAFDIALDTVAMQPSLPESLMGQIGAMALPDDLRALSLHLVGELREDGYLDTPLPEIARDLAKPVAALEAALEVVQQCEPAGVGARSLAECLELQLRDLGLDQTLARRVVSHIDRFGEDEEGLDRTLGVPPVRAREIAGMIGGLKAQPVAEREAPAAVLLPDLVLERDDSGSFRVTTGRATLPEVRINTSLVSEGAAFGAEALARAESLVQALQYRSETLLRIGERLALHQKRVFIEGPDALRPLTRATLATELGLHPSTVGRAVAGKALDVEGRLWPLERFFSKALPVAGSEAASAFVVQRSIARLIASEPSGAPLSDLRLSELLLAEGVDISRRTVAKYRGRLRIPPSHERRRRRARRSVYSPGTASDGFAKR